MHTLSDTKGRADLWLGPFPLKRLCGQVGTEHYSKTISVEMGITVMAVWGLASLPVLEWIGCRSDSWALFRPSAAWNMATSKHILPSITRIGVHWVGISQRSFFFLLGLSTQTVYPHWHLRTQCVYCGILIAELKVNQLCSEVIGCLLCHSKSMALLVHCNYTVIERGATSRMGQLVYCVQQQLDKISCGYFYDWHSRINTLC